MEKHEDSTTIRRTITQIRGPKYPSRPLQNLKSPTSYLHVLPYDSTIYHI